MAEAAEPEDPDLESFLVRVFEKGKTSKQYYQLLRHVHGMAYCDLPHLTEEALIQAGIGKQFHRRRIRKVVVQLFPDALLETTSSMSSLDSRGSSMSSRGSSMSSRAGSAASGGSDRDLLGLGDPQLETVMEKPVVRLPSDDHRAGAFNSTLIAPVR